jgi:hypothetical protein
MVLTFDCLAVLQQIRVIVDRACQHLSLLFASGAFAYWGHSFIVILCKDGNDYAPVHITLKIGWTEKRKALVDIADLRDSEMDIFGRYIQEGKKPFPFTVHFPDPEDLTKRDSFDAQQSVCFHLIVAFIVMWLNVLTLLCRGLVRLRSMRCEEFCSIFLLMEVGLCTFLLRELAFKSSFNV